MTRSGADFPLLSRSEGYFEVDGLLTDVRSSPADEMGDNTRIHREQFATEFTR